ncbi:MAG: hypothetical protein Q4F05_04465 [bacterium]|nr:hypothetical protein [bacterium]
MKRPYVQAKGINRSMELKKELNNHLQLFLQFKDIAGIMLNGGISRGFADSLSEIDVVIFLHKEQFYTYKNEITPTALGITKIDHYLYDIKLCCYEEEMERTYEQLELWDLSYAQIIYDPNEELKQLFEEKLKTTVEYTSAGGYLFDAWWHYRLAGDIWITRMDTAQGHFILNAAIAPLLSALFIINKVYIPHEKWLIHMSRSLAWRPNDYERQLEQLICIKDSSLQCLIDRQLVFHQLWTELDAKLCELTVCPAGINLMHLSSYQSLYSLYEQGEISRKDWSMHHSIDELNYDPLNKLIKLNGDTISFQYDLLNSLTEDDLYSWFYQIADALRQNTKY